VLNLENPGQGFCPYMPIRFTRDDVDGAAFKEVELGLDKENKARFSLKLTKFLHANAEASKSASNTLQTKEATRWELLNSPEVFTRILAESHETRVWLEKVHKSSPVHFAVALITVLDASFNVAAESTSKAELSVVAPVGEAVAPGSSAVPSVGDSLDVQTELAKERTEKQNAKFLVPGDRIVAVQYRRIKFKGYKSANVDGAFLEKGSRWKKYTGTDVVRGDGEDILEATLEEKPMLDGLGERYTFEAVPLDNDILLRVRPNSLSRANTKSSGNMRPRKTTRRRKERRRQKTRRENQIVDS
jgi:hypothetical protein